MSRDYEEEQVQKVLMSRDYEEEQVQKVLMSRDYKEEQIQNVLMSRDVFMKKSRYKMSRDFTKRFDVS